MVQPIYTYSGVCYTATPGQDVFALTSTEGNPIGYLSPDHIHVRVSVDNGKTWDTKRAATAFSFTNPATAIRLTTPATAGEWIDIRRITPTETDWVDFKAGSLLTAEQLNEAELFSLYCDQEIIDGVRNGTIAPEDDGVMEIIAGSNVVIDPADGKGSVTISAVQANPGVTKIKAGNNVEITPSGGTGEVTINSVDIDPGVTKITAGANITITPTKGTGNVTITGVGGGGGGGIVYKGTKDVTGPAPAGPQNGDFWVNTTDGIASNSWTGISGQSVAEGDRVIYNGSSWDLLPSPSITGYLPLAGGNLTGDLTLGTDKITLDVTDGKITTDNIETTGRVDVGTADNPVLTDTAISAINNSTDPTIYIENKGAGEVSIEATGNIEANKFIGDGSLLTNLPGGGGGGDVGTLQQVTDKGSTTTNDISIGGTINASNTSAAGNAIIIGNANQSVLAADGSASFRNSLIVGDIVNSGYRQGFTCVPGGVGSYLQIYGKNTDTAPNLSLYNGDIRDNVFKVSSTGTVTANAFVGDGSGLTNVDLQAVTDAGSTTTNGATFRGDVAIGDSATLFKLLSDVVAALPADIKTRFASNIASWNQASAYVDAPTTLPADTPTPLRDAVIRATTAGKINLNSDGTAMFGGEPELGAAPGIKFYSPQGSFAVCGDQAGQNVFIGYELGNAVPTTYITADGNVVLNGTITAGNFNIDQLDELD